MYRFLLLLGTGHDLLIMHVQSKYSTRLPNFACIGCYISSEQHTIKNVAVYLMYVFYVHKLFDMVRRELMDGWRHAVQAT
jgi:hypothetical protein